MKALLSVRPPLSFLVFPESNAWAKPVMLSSPISKQNYSLNVWTFPVLLKQLFKESQCLSLFREIDSLSLCDLPWITVRFPSCIFIALRRFSCLRNNDTSLRWKITLISRTCLFDGYCLSLVNGFYTFLQDGFPKISILLLQFFIDYQLLSWTCLIYVCWASRLVKLNSI